MSPVNEIKQRASLHICHTWNGNLSKRYENHPKSETDRKTLSNPKHSAPKNDVSLRSSLLFLNLKLDFFTCFKLQSKNALMWYGSRIYSTHMSSDYQQLAHDFIWEETFFRSFACTGKGSRVFTWAQIYSQQMSFTHLDSPIWKVSDKICPTGNSGISWRLNWTGNSCMTNWIR